MKRTYAGIGSRTTPEVIQLEMYNIAKGLNQLGFILRSGGAKGADHAFEEGCDDGDDPSLKEIYLPWKNFENNPSPLYHLSEEAQSTALHFHPNPEWLKTKGTNVLKLMSRNSYQVLGPNLDDPVDLVICWTQDGCENGQKTTKATGGTGQALRIATAYQIPIVNLKNEDALDKLLSHVGVR